MTDARTHLKGLELLKTGDVSAIGQAQPPEARKGLRSAGAQS